MSLKETDLVVSILNLLTEKIGLDVDTNGFGYNEDTLEISCADCYFVAGLECLWETLRNSDININYRI